MTEPAVSGLSCLVIGGRGFVGSAITAEAVARGYKVIVVEKDNYESHVGAAADIVIDANGNSKKFLAKQDPKLEFDLSVRSVVRSLHDFHAGLYVFLSTIDVYPNVSQPSANREDVPIEPRSLTPYGFHKYLAECLVRYYAPKWLIFRMGGFVGPGLWKNSIYDLLKGHPLRVHPNSRYQYLHTRDLARMVLDIAGRSRENDIFNIAGEGTISLREVAAFIPSASIAPENSTLPCEHYEVNTDKIKAHAPLPRTVETVRAFVHNVLSGREKIL